MSAVLPEIVYQNVVEHGLRLLVTDQSLIDDLFSDFPADIRSYIKTYFAKTTNIPVRLGWPRPDMTLPAINISLGSEQESDGNDLLGDHMEEGYVRNAEGEVSQIGEISGFGTACSHNLLVLTQSSDATVYLYNVVRRIIFVNKMALEEAGIKNLRINGSDMQFEENYFPEFVFARNVNLSCNTWFTVAPPPEVVAKFVIIREPTDAHPRLDVVQAPT